MMYGMCLFLGVILLLFLVLFFLVLSHGVVDML